jgi:hypothetical protein
MADEIHQLSITAEDLQEEMIKDADSVIRSYNKKKSTLSAKNTRLSAKMAGIYVKSHDTAVALNKILNKMDKLVKEVASALL